LISWNTIPAATEIKGFETPEWRLKWKLFDALHPAWEKQVIK
jgi:hypothetical protein